MPIVLRRRITLPMMKPDGTFESREFATTAFVHTDGAQYAQLNVEASEVVGIENGATLTFAETRPHDLIVPTDQEEMFMPPCKIKRLEQSRPDIKTPGEFQVSRPNSINSVFVRFVTLVA